MCAHLSSRLPKLFCLTFCATLVALFLLGTGASAQPESAQPLTANLFVWINAPNSATVVFRTESETVPDKFFSANWLPLLNRALGTELHQVKNDELPESTGERRELLAQTYSIGTRQSLLRRGGQIDPAPLLPTLRSMGFVWLTVNLMPQKLPLIGVKGATEQPYQEKSFRCFYRYVNTSDHSPSPIRYTLGYPAASAYQIPAVYALLLLPILLTLWVRKRALKAEADANIDPAVVWFGFARFLNWLTVGTWILWFAALITSDIDPLLRFIIDTSVYSRALGLVCWLQYLPAPVLVLCAALSHPVFARLRGLELSRTDLVRRAIWGQARFFCFACFGIALFNLTLDARLSVLWVLVGIASMTLASQASMKSQGMRPEALSVGELRDRIFTLAEAAGVRVQQIYVLPAGKGRLANAFAASGNRILLTDYLLQHLSKREVDAVVAHELTHLRRRHPRALTLIWVALFVGVNATLLLLSARSSDEYFKGLVYSLTMIAGFFLTYFFSRRFEWVADAGAVSLTRDPEACITGLTKISRLNMMPLQWGKLAGSWLTHPATLHRAEAIARLGKVSNERLQELLASSQEMTSSVTGAEDRYPLPSAHHEKLLFSTNYKSLVIACLYWGTLVVTALVPALTASGARWAKLEGGGKWAMYLVGLILTFLARRFVGDVLNRLAYRHLERTLRHKFSVEAEADSDAQATLAVATPPAAASFVGLSPAASPRLYENFYDRDIGLVWFEPDAFIYSGEHEQFQLQRQQIVKVEARADRLGWWNWQRVFITWRNEEKEATFYIRPEASGSQRGSRRATQNFLEQFESWRRGELKELGQNELGLSGKAPGLPSVQEITSQSPKKLCSPANLLVNVILYAFTAICVCALFSFSQRRAQTEEWYVLAASILVFCFDMVPLCLYREPKGRGT